MVKLFAQDRVAEDGFTARVMQSLPPPRRKTSGARAWVLGAATLLASAVGLGLPVVQNALSSSFDALAQVPSTGSVPWVGAVVLMVMVLVTVLVVAEDA